MLKVGTLVLRSGQSAVRSVKTLQPLAVYFQNILIDWRFAFYDSALCWI
jgi:hypothetical protein